MTDDTANRDKIKQRKDLWEENVLKKRVKRFNLAKSPTTFYTPLAVEIL